MALLGLLVDDVVEAQQLDARLLKLVPEREHDQHRAVREGDQRVEGHELPERQPAVDHLERADEQEDRERGEVDELEQALVGEDDELGAEGALRERLEAAEHRAAQRVLRRERLHRLDAADRVDLARGVAAVVGLEVVVGRP